MAEDPAADVELALGEVQLTLYCSEYIAFLVFSSSFPSNKTLFYEVWGHLLEVWCYLIYG